MWKAMAVNKEKSRPSESYTQKLKCDECRRTKKKCDPQNRVWPSKCHLCIEKNKPCSEGRLANGPSAPEHSKALPSPSLQTLPHYIAPESASELQRNLDSLVCFENEYLTELPKMVQAKFAEGLGITVRNIVMFAQIQLFCRPKVEGGYAARKQWYEFVIMAEFEDVVESKLRNEPWLAVHGLETPDYEADVRRVLAALKDAQHCLLGVVRQELRCCPTGALWLDPITEVLSHNDEHPVAWPGFQRDDGESLASQEVQCDDGESVTPRFHWLVESVGKEDILKHVEANPPLARTLASFDSSFARFKSTKRAKLREEE